MLVTVKYITLKLMAGWSEGGYLGMRVVGMPPRKVEMAERKNPIDRNRLGSLCTEAEVKDIFAHFKCSFSCAM